MWSLCKSLLLISGLGLANFAQASDFYIGFGLGAANQKTELEIVDTTPSATTTVPIPEYFPPKDTSMQISMMAGYRLTSDIFFEFGYVDFGDVSKSAINTAGNNVVDTSDNTAKYIALVHQLPISDNFASYLKLGVANWDFRYDSAETNGLGVVTESNLSDSSTDFFIGLGMSYGSSADIEWRAWVEYYPIRPDLVNLDAEQNIAVFSIQNIHHF